MKIFWRMSAISLALILAFTGCGRSDIQQTQQQSEPQVSQSQPEQVQRVRLPFFPEDTLNPYTCQTLQNSCLTSLLYDPLVTLDQDYQPKNRLAQEVTVEGTSCVVKLRSGLTFSDGSPLTSADVLASLELARQTPRYSAALTGVVGAEAPDSNTLVITLSQADIYFPRSLTFPILQIGTEAQERPVGCGRFVLEEGQTRMVVNESYYRAAGNIRTVELVATQTMEEQSYGVMEGTIDLMYSDLQSDLNLGLGIGYRQIPLSNMVYLGVNSQRLGWDEQTRCVFSAMMDREEIARKAYMGFAAATALPINPAASATALGVAQLDLSVDRQNQQLDALGWQQRDSEGWRTQNGRRFSVGLLINSENNDRQSVAQLIKDSCAQLGVEIVVEALPFEQFQERIAQGQYDLYLGEVKMPGNLDLSRVLFPDPQLGPGAADDQELRQAHTQLHSGELSQEDFEAMLEKKMPVIPLLFRRGIFCFSRDFSANIVATEQDIFYNIEEW